ncbi:MAG: RNA pyrophosphohydrolase [Planctomycetota bacterium]
MTGTTGVTFRAGVGVVVINRAGLVLALERSDVPGAWQLPQGGLEVGETPADAALRELHEETGIAASEVEPIAELEEWLAYELPLSLRRPHVGRGQVQRWFLLRWTGADGEIDLAAASDQEFRAWRWMRFADLVAATAEFRRSVYVRLGEGFALHLAP